VITINVPIQTVSELNARDHWAVRNKRRQAQKKAVYYAWKETMFGHRTPQPPLVVRFTRFGPRLLDDDNLRGALKYARDTVADLLGIDDGDSRIRFEYAQRIDSDYSVTIEVEGSKKM